MTPRRRVTDQPHGPEMVATALDNLRARFPVAFARLAVSPVHPNGTTLCGCGSLAVAWVSDGDGGRDALCFRHAEDELAPLEPAPAPETTRDRSSHREAR